MKAKLLLVCVLFMLGNLSVTQSATGQNPDSVEISTRTTLMLHIVNYSRWSNSFSKQNFCFLEQQNAIYFSELLKDEFVKSAKIPLDVLQLDTLSDASSKRCHYLFIDQASESNEVYQQLEALTEQMVTVGESSKFVSKGGLVSLVSEFDRVKIYISRDKYEVSPVKFSARLLKFANFTG